MHLPILPITKSILCHLMHIKLLSRAVENYLKRQWKYHGKLKTTELWFNKTLIGNHSQTDHHAWLMSVFPISECLNWILSLEFASFCNWNLLHPLQIHLLYFSSFLDWKFERHMQNTCFPMEPAKHFAFTASEKQHLCPPDISQTCNYIDCTVAGQAWLPHHELVSSSVATS